MIRSLGRKGIEVHVAWCPDQAIALKSRYVSAVHRLPPVYLKVNAWKAALASLMVEEDYDLVIPCHDQMIIPLQKHAGELRQYGNIYLLNAQAYDVVNSKASTSKLARFLGIPVPWEKRISTPGQLDQIARDFSLPVILKPISSFNRNNMTTKRYVRRVYNYDDFLQSGYEMLSEGDLLLQKNFIGKGAGIEVLALHGKVLVAFQHLRVHEPLSGGGSSYRKSVPVDPQLLRDVKRFLETLDYTGVAMVEFKINPKTGEYILVEINGRFWGSLPLAVVAGIDFPYYLYQMLVHGKTKFEGSYRENVYCRNLSRDLIWMRDNLKADHADQNLDTLPWSVVAGEINNFIGLREHSDTLALDDPMPGFIELKKLMSKVFTKSALKLYGRIMDVEAIRRYGQKRIYEKLRNAHRLLFVCKGNICRSPFAEKYARKIFSEIIDVTSSGYFPEANRVSPNNAIEAASEMGIDISAHRSKVLKEKDIRDADVVFTFDSENRRTLLACYPEAKSKVFLLGIAAVSGTLFIDDPYGKNKKEYMRTYRLIAQSLDVLNQKLRLK